MVGNYVSDGSRFPPRGTQGGGDSLPSEAYVTRTDGSEQPRDPIAQVVLEPGELLGHRLTGGGGPDRIDRHGHATRRNHHAAEWRQ